MKNDSLMVPILACLTLGLAPFTPEPHLWGKLKWVAGGAHGMQMVDWFDLAMHGAPWVYLVYVLIKRFLFRKPLKEEEIVLLSFLKQT